MDIAVAGREAGAVAGRGCDFVRNGAPDAQKNKLKPWQQEMWCIPEASADYVACMEDVLDLYEQPYDPLRPQVCYDEWRRALIGETRDELAGRNPDRRKRVDYEYRRNGVALFAYVV